MVNDDTTAAAEPVKAEDAPVLLRALATRPMPEPTREGLTFYAPRILANRYIAMGWAEEVEMAHVMKTLPGTHVPAEAVPSDEPVPEGGGIQPRTLAPGETLAEGATPPTVTAEPSNGKVKPVK